MVPVPADVYLVSLLAAVSWGLGVVVAKRGLTLGGSSVLVAALSATCGTVLFWGVVFVRNGLGAVLELSVVAAGIFLVSGLLGSGIGRLVYYNGVNRVGATIAEACVSVNPLFAALLALVFLREPIEAIEAIGMVVIVGGLFVLSISKGGDISGWERWEVLIPLFAALFFASGHVIRRYGFVLTDTPPIEGTALNAVGALVGILAYVHATGQQEIFRVPRKTYLYFSTAGVFVALGLLFVMTGLSIGRVVVVAPLAGTAPLFAALFSMLLLADVERVTRGVIVGVLCIVIGIVLLTGA